MWQILKEIITGIIWTEPGYKSWMKRKKPIETVFTSGCFNNACGDSGDGCKCNDFNATRKELKNRGFQVVALKTDMTVLWSDGKDVIKEIHAYGR